MCTQFAIVRVTFNQGQIQMDLFDSISNCDKTLYYLSRTNAWFNPWLLPVSRFVERSSDTFIVHSQKKPTTPNEQDHNTIKWLNRVTLFPWIEIASSLSLFIFRFDIIFCIFNLFNVSLQDSMGKRACCSLQWILTATKCVYGIYFNVKSMLVSLIGSFRHRRLCVCVILSPAFSSFYHFTARTTCHNLFEDKKNIYECFVKNRVQIVFDINFGIRLWFLESM